LPQIKPGTSPGFFYRHVMRIQIVALGTSNLPGLEGGCGMPEQFVEKTILELLWSRNF
jgi:hypothetical protein